MWSDTETVVFLAPLISTQSELERERQLKNLLFLSFLLCAEVHREVFRNFRTFLSGSGSWSCLFHCHFLQQKLVKNDV